ncbi:glycosyltransferase family 4 protein [cf. Phormidesmis sp. LEGE 11477]|uniref:glycosyltransferase family 4 protein n=1 Tax=cf. Phormidesmis sp. LEGE 11477 TaxID=1828680 RepID=UPI00187F0B37|nr:glycosyltransferase family 4 protein [cf. Phormidesmis sp. LEGE 11477]MBE9060261.1 glycosyltransferase family 4 protein [cf. Phormidesmis sp. LEGE 11477]
MHVAIIFSHIGNYHLARLSAASDICQTRGWQLTAVQSIEQTKEHPWGTLPAVEGFTLRTLIPASSAVGRLSADVHPESPEAVAALAPCLDAIGPDVLVIPGWGFPISQAALRWAQQHSVPTVLMSESKQDDETRTWWKEQLKSWLYVRKYSSALVGGPAHRDYLVQLGFERDRIFYGYDVVDNDYFVKQAAIASQNAASIRQQYPNIPEKPYFLAVTRLIPRKNMLRVLEAFASYCSLVGIENSWHLVICGSGIETDAIYQLIARKGLKDLVHLPGFLTYEQIAYWYGLAGAFVHPALVEQWGLVVNEACAAGLPILCSNTVGACSSLVKDGENGFTFNPQRTSEIVQSLLKIHSMSERDRANMGRASQAIVAYHSPRQFGEGLLNAINVAL